MFRQGRGDADVACRDLPFRGALEAQPGWLVVEPEGTSRFCGGTAYSTTTGGSVAMSVGTATIRRLGLASRWTRRS